MPSSADLQAEASTQPPAASKTNPSSQGVNNDAELRAKVGDGSQPRHTDAVDEKPRIADDDAGVGNRRSGGGVGAGVGRRVRKNQPVTSQMEHTPIGHCRQCAVVQSAQTEPTLEDAVEFAPIPHARQTPAWSAWQAVAGSVEHSPSRRTYLSVHNWHAAVWWSQTRQCAGQRTLPSSIAKPPLISTQTPQAATMQLPLAGPRQTLPKRTLRDRHWSTRRRCSPRVELSSAAAALFVRTSTPDRDERKTVPVILMESRSFVTLNPTKHRWRRASAA